MIKINLVPYDELESQFWYLPDVATLLVVGVLAFIGAQTYLGSIQEQVEAENAKVASLNASAAALAPVLAKFKTLGEDTEKLNSKLSALQAITVSKISKFKPVVVLEHLQNLKPDGLWFDYVCIGSSEVCGDAGEKAILGGAGLPATEGGAKNDGIDALRIRGESFEDLVTAEFMTSVRSTASQDYDDADLRTQVNFSDLRIESIGQKKGDGQGSFSDLGDRKTFEFTGNIRERLSPARPQGVAPVAPVATTDSKVELLPSSTISKKTKTSQAPSANM